MKRFWLLFLVSVLVCFNASAVLKEKNLGQTVHVLRLELENQLARQKENRKMMEARNKEQHNILADIIERSNKASLMPYSQNQDFTFDVAYACQEATLLYREMDRSTFTPYGRIKKMIENELSRYDSLAYNLKAIPPILLNIKGGNHAELIDEIEHEGELESHAPIFLDKQGIEDSLRFDGDV